MGDDYQEPGFKKVGGTVFQSNDGSYHYSLEGARSHESANATGGFIGLMGPGILVPILVVLVLFFAARFVLTYYLFYFISFGISFVLWKSILPLVLPMIVKNDAVRFFLKITLPILLIIFSITIPGKIYSTSVDSIKNIPGERIIGLEALYDNADISGKILEQLSIGDIVQVLGANRKRTAFRVITSSGTAGWVAKNALPEDTMLDKYTLRSEFGGGNLGYARASQRQIDEAAKANTRGRTFTVIFPFSFYINYGYSEGMTELQKGDTFTVTGTVNEYEYVPVRHNDTDGWIRVQQLYLLLPHQPVFIPSPLPETTFVKPAMINNFPHYPNGVTAYVKNTRNAHFEERHEGGYRVTKDTPRLKAGDTFTITGADNYGGYLLVNFNRLEGCIYGDLTSLSVPAVGRATLAENANVYTGTNFALFNGSKKVASLKQGDTVRVFAIVRRGDSQGSSLIKKKDSQSQQKVDYVVVETEDGIRGYVKWASLNFTPAE